MNAEPLLIKIAAVFAEHRFEPVMIGNAAAALHGAPVTTLDFDFLFRKTPTNVKKLKQIAASLDATFDKPYYPVSNMIRIKTKREGLQLDFLPRASGLRSFEGVRARAGAVVFGSHRLFIASLVDIIKSKRAAGRDRDKAVTPILEETLDEKEKREKET